MKPSPAAWWQLTKLVEARVLLGFLAVGPAIAAFAALADEVREGGTLGVDRTLLLAFRVPGHLDVATGPRWIGPLPSACRVRAIASAGSASG